ncbi:MAG: hypothetical protein L0Z62_30250, partial [Gemmataceae bacterium]|nr:hypothetical protein [Gemmataceae bacterium]
EALAPRWVPRPQIGDLVVVGGAGAYCDGVAQGLGGSARNKKEIKLGENPGREFEMEVTRDGTVLKKGSKVAARVYLVKRRVYQILAAGPEVKPDAKDVRDFLDSLQVR